MDSKIFVKKIIFGDSINSTPEQSISVEDKSKEIVEIIINKLKRDGNGWQIDEIRQMNDKSWEQGVRDAFHWEVPEDEEDDGDYDWKRLTSNSCKKIEKIIKDYEDQYPDYEINWSQEEKCWLSVYVKKKVIQ